jgi:hypothetical protein
MDDNKKLFIHIGAHKTASSYLQMHVYPDMSICYSRTVSTELRWFLENETGAQTEYRGNIEKVKRYIASCNGSVLLSHETIMGHFWDNYKYFEKNIDLLHEHFPDAEIIFITREYDAWRRSVYAESVYTQTETRSFKNAAVSFDFDKAIAYIQKYFKTHVLSFDLFKENNDVFTKHIEKIIGAEFYGRHIAPIRKSLTPFQLQIARFANLIGISRRQKSIIKKIPI